MAVRWTEEEYLDFLRDKKTGKPPAASAMEALGIPTLEPKDKPKARKRAKSATVADPTPEGLPPTKKKRRGVDAGPIIDSIRTCRPRIKVEHGDLPVMTMLFDGARLLSVNEIISILPYRPQVVYRYKSAWRILIKRALHLLDSKDLLHFEGPVRLELVRRSSKTLDDDSTRMPFKYAIDSLVKAKVLKDDDRSVVADTSVVDVVGAHAVAIRIVALRENTRKNEVDPIPQWFPE